jgi:hypothetical protein
MKPEQILSQRASNHLLDKYPNVPFRFDTGADVKLPVQVAKRLHELHGKWSKGHPDLVIEQGRGGYGAYYIELKATETVPDTEHTRRQAMYHAVLRSNGFKVDFVCGLDEFKKKVKSYMKLKKNKIPNS